MGVAGTISISAGEASLMAVARGEARADGKSHTRALYTEYRI